MASAVVCDRCGKTVRLRGDVEGESVSVCRYANSSPYATESGPRWDFCTECWESFLSFVEPEQQEQQPEPDLPAGLDFHWRGQTTYGKAMLWTERGPHGHASVRARGETFTYPGSKVRRRFFLIEAED